MVFQPLRAFTPEPTIAQFLARYFERFRDLQDRPVQTITLCHYAPEESGYLISLSEQQFQEIRDAVNLVLFCVLWNELCEFLAKGYRVAAPPNTETFEIVAQAFTDEMLQMELPYITLPTHGMRYTDKLEKFRFSIPLNAYLRGQVLPEPYLLHLLQRVFDVEFPEQLRRRILRSLEWFRIANQKDYPVQTGVVSIATALETLLAPDENRIKRTLADAVDDWLRKQWGEWAIEAQRDGYSRTAAGFWMWDFYDLRNRIVHGEPVASDEMFVSVPIKRGHEVDSVSVSKTDIASIIYGILLIDYLSPHSDSGNLEPMADGATLDESGDISLRDTQSKVEDTLANLGWRRRLEDDPKAMRLYLQTVLGELLEPLSSESLIRERSQERPEPAVEDITKG
ncbi:MAG: hypothetical protein K6U77_07145 [Armatimonadetes bacterium]|nr:hypothetical protein [Armatimonadota bacterium]